MKIVFTGSGTGGHFYPLIAVAEAVQEITNERKLLEPRMYLIGPEPFDEQALFKNNIQFIKVPAGKLRRYIALRNISDVFVTVQGIISALIQLFKIYPDVVFSKGSYTSVPTVIAAHILRIPIVIHESDAKPGRATLLAAKYAYKIGVTFDSVVKFLPEKVHGNVARTGTPIRTELKLPEKDGAKQLLGLDASVPTVLIVGGSLGSQRINETILDGLADLVKYVNVIHQTGKANFDDVQKRSTVVLENSAHKNRYHVFPYLSAESLSQAAGAADVIVSRAGSGTITEISFWKKPAILIPIPERVSHDQRTNAYAYAHTGAAVVLEEENITPHILVSEIRRIASDPEVARTMGEKGSAFGNPNAARIIAEELIAIGLSHEPAPEPPVETEQASTQQETAK